MIPRWVIFLWTFLLVIGVLFVGIENLYQRQDIKSLKLFEKEAKEWWFQKIDQNLEDIRALEGKKGKK